MVDHARYRVAYWIAAFVMIALMGGSVYGWPSLRAVLFLDAHLAEGCDEGDAVCDPQLLAFGLVYTVGSWANQGGRLFVGICVDRYGPRRVSAVSCLAFCAGALVFGLSTQLRPSSTAVLSVAFGLIGIGGAGTQLSVQSVTALFPKNRSLVMATLSGAFQLASGVYLVFELAHGAGATLPALMYGYSAVALVAAGLSCFIWPSRPWGAGGGGGGGGGSGGGGKPADVPLRDRDFRGQATSPEYGLLLSYFSVNALQCQFTVMTINTQLARMDDDGTMRQTFSTALALSFFATPLVGHLFDRCGFPRIMALVNSLLILTNAVLMSGVLPIQPIACVTYAVGRVGLWASFFAFCGATFGFRNYGKLAGGGLLFASLVALLQYPLLHLSLAVGSFLPVNALFVGLAALQFVVIGFLHRRLRRRGGSGATTTTLEAPPAEPARV